MKTLIRTKDDTCDLDDGIHFNCKPDVTPNTLKSWVYQAVKDHTTGGAQNKTKCVRVVYKNDYHIDLPIYKKEDNDDYPWLAVKNKQWDEEESDPKGFVDWYNEKKSNQMTRMIRCLKSWGDHVRNNMLSGLAMTLLAEDNLDSNDRDDIALKDILVSMKNELEDSWELHMPVSPEDDVLDRYDEDFQYRFFSRLDKFIEDAEAAIDEESQLKASRLWRKHLGQRFPLGEDSTEKEKSNLSSLHGIAATGTYKPYGDE